MQMIERVARVIDPDVFRARDVCQGFLLSARQPWEGSYEKKMHDAKIDAALERARAAIEAAIEPSDKMITAGKLAHQIAADFGEDWGTQIKDIWKGMLNTALQEGKETGE